MISVEQIANAAIDACESSGIDYMLTGALAFNYYAVPRSTKDFDLVIDISSSNAIATIIEKWCREHGSLPASAPSSTPSRISNLTITSGILN